MPALAPEPLVASLLERNITNVTHSVTNATAHGIQVICAWPVSGQYGFGSRILYYIFVAACVLARKNELIKNACLAAALLLPAVAALHGIILAALHVPGAVDLDIYGAFQFCAIGILAAPVTVRLSKTYFYDPGRNTIFLWAALILAGLSVILWVGVLGLLSLTIEFYRSTSTTCTYDDNHNKLSSSVSEFLKIAPTCGLKCSPEPGQGPFSPMRTGASKDIYVVPAPNRLTFGSATLLAAACCVHAILWLASMFEKILEINWKSQLREKIMFTNPETELTGTNGATVGKMNSVNDMVKFMLSVAVIPIFMGAGLAILIVGERNFWSLQMRYENEPFANIGQWSPIVAAILAGIGSLYLIFAKDVEALQDETNSASRRGCSCNCCDHTTSRNLSTHTSSSQSDIALSNRPSHDSDRSSHDHEHGDLSLQRTASSRTAGHALVPASTGASGATITKIDTGGRLRVAKAFAKVAKGVGSAAHELFDDSEFRRGKAVDWPEIPGEAYRSSNLHRIRQIYNPPRDAEGNATPIPGSRSRAASFVGSSSSRVDVASVLMDGEEPTNGPRSPSPTPSTLSNRRQRARTMPTQASASETDGLNHMSIGDQAPNAPPRRRDTLEVPSSAHPGSMRRH